MRRDSFGLEPFFWILAFRCCILIRIDYENSQYIDATVGGSRPA